VHTPKRLKPVLLLWGIFLIVLPSRVCGQDDTSVPLGDVARSFRKKTIISSEAVIDNDNLSKVVDDAESRRAAGSSPVFSLDPGGRNFHVSSPDVTCSLSFTAKNGSPQADSLLLDELPRIELAKLDGPAIIDGDSLQVAMHNGSSWELREVVIGLTIVKRPDAADTSSNVGQPRIIPAAGPLPEQGSFQKQPDVTLLLRVKGSAAPSATALFRTSLNFALFPDQEWHWAIVRAKGIPPQPGPEAMITKNGKGAGPQPADAVPAPLINPAASDLATPVPPPPNPVAAAH
jgi:hypothetical protein